MNGLHQPLAALEALEKAAALDPAHAAIRLNLGNAYADLDQLDIAERHIRAAIALDPAMVEAHASLGFILGGQGRYAEAIAACNAALALDPKRIASAHVVEIGSAVPWSSPRAA
jgi:tetratricopeptide (TPR) repeat protein